MRIVYYILVILTILAFVYDYLYTTKYVVPVENTTLERWAIILTLGGIFATLKYLHPKLKEQDREDADCAVKKYKVKYYIRFASILAIAVFNLVCLNITGLQNFSFLCIITIFAMFLCIPNKKHLEEETTKHNEEA